MKTFILLIFLAGCGSTLGTPDAALDAAPDTSTAPPPCLVASTDVVGYQDCGGGTKDGYYCVATCGRLPDDGGAGTLIGPGCTVEIGTSTPLTGLCVAACSECR